MKSGLAYLASVVIISLCLGLGVSALARAESGGDEFGSRRQIPKSNVPPTPEKKWKEQSWQLPPYPDPARLRGGELSIQGSSFAYQVDLDSLSIGNDGVVRYAIVITSPSGAQNVFYDGIRCQTAEYKTYAYGSQGKWQAAAYPEWQSLELVRGSRHRVELFQYYLCDDFHAPLTRKQIVSRFDGTYRFNQGRR